mmetsp:Transcript_11908/g.31288  ORF Transcript_11908/g.31288 Transcript_11908/m.31288 type:complete len:351 (+) Transcript_11908:2069-3121(+)
MRSKNLFLSAKWRSKTGCCARTSLTHLPSGAFLRGRGQGSSFGTTKSHRTFSEPLILLNENRQPRNSFQDKPDIRRSPHSKPSSSKVERCSSSTRASPTLKASTARPSKSPRVCSGHGNSFSAADGSVYDSSRANKSASEGSSSIEGKSPSNDASSSSVGDAADRNAARAASRSSTSSSTPSSSTPSSSGTIKSTGTSRLLNLALYSRNASTTSAKSNPPSKSSKRQPSCCRLCSSSGAINDSSRKSASSDATRGRGGSSISSTSSSYDSPLIPAQAGTGTASPDDWEDLRTASNRLPGFSGAGGGASFRASPKSRNRARRSGCLFKKVPWLRMAFTRLPSFIAHASSGH